MFIHDPTTNRLRVTRRDQEKYRTRLGRVGYDIQTLRTPAALAQAVDAMIASELQNVAAEIRGDDPELDAILSGLPGFD